jgi:hypothetical protein
MATKSSWIDVKERLPEKEGVYLSYTPAGNVRQAHFDKDKCWRPSGSNRVTGYLDVSHWRNLPAPPGSPEDLSCCIPDSSKAQIRNLLTPSLTLATITLEDPQYKDLPECAQQVKTSVDKILEILKESPTVDLVKIKEESLDMICGLCCSLNPHHSHDVKNCRCSQTEFLRGK